MMNYCNHGGRLLHWLPYIGWDDISGKVNVTYYGSGSQLIMHKAWRKNNPKSPERPFCVIAKMGTVISIVDIYNDFNTKI